VSKYSLFVDISIMQDLIEALKREVDLHKSNFYKMERNYRNVQESNRTLSCKCKELEEEKVFIQPSDDRTTWSKNMKML
jgi:hypothetical protein